MIKKPDGKLTLKEAVTIPEAPDAIVVGIDKYSFTAADSRRHSWESYTLTSSAAAPFDRFWIANVPDQGAFRFTRAQTSRPGDAVFSESLSGLCQLESTGDAALSSAFSALSCWQQTDGTIHSIEVFSEGDAIAFLGKPFLTP